MDLRDLTVDRSGHLAATPLLPTIPIRLRAKWERHGLREQARLVQPLGGPPSTSSSSSDSPQAHVLSPSWDQAWPSALRARQGRGHGLHIQQWALGSLSLQVTKGLLDRRGTKEKWALRELQVRPLWVALGRGDGRTGVRHPSAEGQGWAPGRASPRTPAP